MILHRVMSVVERVGVLDRQVMCWWRAVLGVLLVACCFGRAVGGVLLECVPLEVLVRERRLGG